MRDHCMPPWTGNKRNDGSKKVIWRSSNALSWGREEALICSVGPLPHVRLPSWLTSHHQHKVTELRVGKRCTQALLSQADPALQCLGPHIKRYISNLYADTHPTYQWMLIFKANNTFSVFLYNLDNCIFSDPFLNSVYDFFPLLELFWTYSLHNVVAGKTRTLIGLMETNTY